MITINHNQNIYANSKQQTANSKQQTANSKQQTANSKQQTANSKQQTANSKHVDCYTFLYLKIRAWPCFSKDEK